MKGNIIMKPITMTTTPVVKQATEPVATSTHNLRPRKRKRTKLEPLAKPLSMTDIGGKK